MAFTPDQLVPMITPYLGPVMEIMGMVIQLIGILAFIGYAILMFMFDVRLHIREVAEGKRTIETSTRARRFIDKKTGAPKLKLFGIFGFKGEIMNEPPAECLVPTRSRLTPRAYTIVKKDGLYYPVNNLVIGIRQKVFDEKTQKEKEVYSLEGTGLEINRDYNAEQAIQNTMIEKAQIYRTKKPVEVVAAMAMVIIAMVVSGVIMWFAWKQFGNMAQAIAGLKEPLKEGIMGAAQGILGPG